PYSPYDYGEDPVVELDSPQKSYPLKSAGLT
ncbi:unnamed protein product, partial [marine sediment metagenome]